MLIQRHKDTSNMIMIYTHRVTQLNYRNKKMLLSNSAGRFFLLSLWLSITCRPVLCQCNKPPIIFNFGDSNSDTGGLAAGLGFPVNPPNGRVFFGHSTGRLSDGRLIIDFLCESVNGSLLSPYLESMGGTFKNGANFAVVGSATLPKYVPFSLNIQLMQFFRFKSRSLQLVTSGSRNWIDEEGFHNALYMIDIGQNDIADSFAKNMSYAQVIRKIPSVVIQIKDAVKAIYDQGGRKFWVHNTGPLGCLPQKLAMVRTTSQDRDTMGCISSYNAAAKIFNQELNLLCQQMRSEMKDATIIYVDIYSIKYDMIANSTKYGFLNPLMACCGNGGAPYNYNIHAQCGQTGSQACNEEAKSISWDGIHYTEAANYFVASKILSVQYSTPHTPFNFFCRG